MPENRVGSLEWVDYPATAKEEYEARRKREWQRLLRLGVEKMFSDDPPPAMPISDLERSMRIGLGLSNLPHAPHQERFRPSA